METELKTNKELLEILTIDSHKKMFEKAMLDLPKCRDCDSDEYISTIVRGRPIATAVEISRLTGFFKLAGCCIDGDETNFICRKCQKEIS
jgi:hypothetical protein